MMMLHVDHEAHEAHEAHKRCTVRHVLWNNLHRRTIARLCRRMVYENTDLTKEEEEVS